MDNQKHPNHSRCVGPGMYGGQALAEILFGEVNPSGKLPITIPKHAGQIPMYYYQRPSRYWTGYGLGSSREDEKTCILFRSWIKLYEL